MISRVLVLLGLAAVGLPAFGADRIELRLVVGDEAKARQREGEIDLFLPRFTRCDDCVDVSFTPPSGGSVTVEAERKPRLVLTDSDIEEIRLIETRNMIAPSVEQWVAIAIPSGTHCGRLASPALARGRPAATR